MGPGKSGISNKPLLPILPQDAFWSQMGCHMYKYPAHWSVPLTLVKGTPPPANLPLSVILMLASWNDSAWDTDLKAVVALVIKLMYDDHWVCSLKEGYVGL